MLVNLLQSKTTIALQNKVVAQFNTPFLYFTSDGAYLSCHLPVRRVPKSLCSKYLNNQNPVRYLLKIYFYIICNHKGM